jgi:hypothetical protein
MGDLKKLALFNMLEIWENLQAEGKELVGNKWLMKQCFGKI